MALIQDKTIDQQADSIAHYLPNGPLFEAKFVDGTNLRKLLRGLAAELERYYIILNDVAEDYDILKTQVLINLWESALGIPGTCFDNSGSLEERRLKLLIKLKYLHGQTVDDYINLAALLGFTIEIELCKTHGMFPMAFPIYFFPTTTSVLFSMIITLPSDDEPIGFPLTFPIVFTTPQNALLQCLFDRLRPAPVKIYYKYS